MTKHELARQIAAGAGITAGQAASGETIQIAASRAAKFSAAAALKQQLNS